jgi:hypothetical protein
VARFALVVAIAALLAAPSTARIQTPGTRAKQTVRGLAALGPRVAGSATEQVMTGSKLHLGSARLLRSLSTADRRSVRLALSLDMVGVGPELNVRGIELSANRSALKALAAARRVGVHATYLPDRGQSDHEELTRGGVNAAWIEWRWDTCWHSACDRAGRLSTGKLGAAIRLTAEAVRAAAA